MYLLQKLEIQIKSNHGHVCAVGIHFTMLVLPTSKSETLARPEQSLFRRVSSPRMAQGSTNNFELTDAYAAHLIGWQLRQHHGVVSNHLSN